MEKPAEQIQIPEEVNKTPFEKLLEGGQFLLTDLFAQLLNLVVILNKESDKISSKPILSNNATEKPKEEIGSPITVRAFKTSIILLQFNALETMANLLAAISVETSSGILGSPDPSEFLTQTEIDFLAEQQTYLDTTTGALKVRTSAYAATLDKLALAPFLLAKIYGQQFRLDKSRNDWQNIRQLKEIRDKLTHSKMNLSPDLDDFSFQPDLNNIKPAVSISSKELFKGCEAIRWYFQQIRDLFKIIYKDKYLQFADTLTAPDFLNWMVLLNLHKNCGISYKRFLRDYPSPKVLIKPAQDSQTIEANLNS